MNIIRLLSWPFVDRTAAKFTAVHNRREGAQQLTSKGELESPTFKAAKISLQRREVIKHTDILPVTSYPQIYSEINLEIK